MAGKTQDLSYMALMTALLVLCAWLTIPLGPVTFTMQTFGVFAALGILGGRRGTAAILVYLALGLVGLPVFSGFSNRFMRSLMPRMRRTASSSTLSFT